MPISSNNELEKDLHSEVKATQLMDYVETLATKDEMPQECNSELETLLDLKFEQLSDSLQRQLGQFFGEFESRFEQLRENITAPSQPEDVKADEEPLKKTISTRSNRKLNAPVETEWDRQKRKILEEHGFVTETDSPPEKDEPENVIDDREPPRAGIEDEDDNLDALHDSIQSIDAIDSAEIDQLKAELTSKLRDAEVELSINRAKLSQQWAALEQKQFEITQHESALRSKYGKIEITSRKPGLLDRLSRHLSKNRRITATMKTRKSESCRQIRVKSGRSMDLFFDVLSSVVGNLNCRTLATWSIAGFAGKLSNRVSPICNGSQAIHVC